MGIMVPNVKTGVQARSIVNAAKYAPLEDRGVIMGNAHTDFQAVNAAEFMSHDNENTTVICQIESVEGMNNLTQSMGIPGQFHHKRFLDAMSQVVLRRPTNIISASGFSGKFRSGSGVDRDGVQRYLL